MKMRTGWTICPLLALLVSVASAGVIHVPGDFDQINDAVQACAAGDTVLVAAGTYHDCTHETEGPESTPACVIMKSGVTLIGAGPTATIIDAQQAPPDGDGRGIFIENVTDCRVENLQVTGCFAETYGAGILVRNVGPSVELTDLRIYANGDGGIICINNASPVLTRIEFLDNLAKQGGGLSIEENSNPLVTQCFLENNTAPIAAGIMIRNSSPVISFSTIQNNPASAANTNGGGITVISSFPDIDRCRITGNTSLGNGGGLAYQGNSGGSLTHCWIQGNIASGPFSMGGGIYLEESDTSIQGVFVVENETTGFEGDGGGIVCLFAPSPSLENCTIAGNAAGTSGTVGGILCQFSAAPTIDKCIVAFATRGAGLGCVGATPVISCSDVYGNAGGDALCGTNAGGNFSADPLFCTTGANLYYLTDASPCAPGNHPGGAGTCGDARIGAGGVSCNATAVGDPVRAADFLVGNSPNPFNPQTTIFFVLEQPGPASLRIFDLGGRLIESFSWDDLGAGTHQVVWRGRNQEGRDVASGVYLYQLQTHGRQDTQRMSLIR